MFGISLFTYPKLLLFVLCRTEYVEKENGMYGRRGPRKIIENIIKCRDTAVELNQLV